MKKILFTFLILSLSFLLPNTWRISAQTYNVTNIKWFVASEKSLDIASDRPNRFMLGIVRKTDHRMVFIQARSKNDGLPYGVTFSNRTESPTKLFSNLEQLTHPAGTSSGCVKLTEEFYYWGYSNNVVNIKNIILSQNPDASYTCNICYDFRNTIPSTPTTEELWVDATSSGQMKYSPDKSDLTVIWKQDHWQIRNTKNQVLKAIEKTSSLSQTPFLSYEFVDENTDGYDVTFFVGKFLKSEKLGLKKKLNNDNPNDFNIDALFNNSSHYCIYFLPENNTASFYLGGEYKTSPKVIDNETSVPVPNLEIEQINGMNLAKLTVIPANLSSINTSVPTRINLYSLGDFEYSRDSVITPTYKTLILVKSNISPEWNIGTKSIPENQLTLNYSPHNDAQHQLRQTFDYSSLEKDYSVPEWVDNREIDTPELPDGFILTDDGGICMQHSEFWDFTDANDKRTVILKGQDNILPACVIGNPPNLTVTVKPAKPTFELNYEQYVPCPENEWGDWYQFTFPNGIYEEGLEYTFSQYARVVITPQFDTFEHEDAATAFYGIAPDPQKKDTWLCNKWFKERELEGFMPLMEWNDIDKEYYFGFNPYSMMYYDWDGNWSFDHKLISGHYKIQLIPSIDPESRQYGVVASDPVDLYIYPSHTDMTLSLCQRDKADGEAYWKNYSMNNVDYLFTGPRADADKNGNTSGGHGETAYRHARLTANSDYCEVWVENNYHRPAYPDGEIPGQKVSRKDVARAADDNQSLEGYTKLEPDDYVDFSGDGQVNVKLVKNGAVSPAQTISVQKTGSPIITGIDDVTINSKSTRPEYFTPAGIKIETPNAPGLYIERHNSRTRKVVLK